MSATVNPSPWRRVDPPEYDARGVPGPLRRAVQVLNEALAINRRVVSDLLGDSRFPLDEYSIAAFGDHPSIVLAEGRGTAVLSGLGLIQGLVMTPRFRLCGVYEDDDTYTEFFVFEDTRAARPELLVPAEEAILHGKQALEAAQAESGVLSGVILDAWRQQSFQPIANVIVDEDGIPAIDTRKTVSPAATTVPPTSIDILSHVKEDLKR
jgi:hypothetical protein